VSLLFWWWWTYQDSGRVEMDGGGVEIVVLVMVVSGWLCMKSRLACLELVSAGEFPS
jgi:hypothetical protein